RASTVLPSAVPRQDFRRSAACSVFYVIDRFVDGAPSLLGRTFRVDGIAHLFDRVVDLLTGTFHRTLLPTRTERCGHHQHHAEGKNSHRGSHSHFRPPKPLIGQLRLTEREVCRKRARYRFLCDRWFLVRI